MLTLALTGLVCIAALTLLAWLWSLHTGKVSFVDSLWSLFFLLLCLVYVVGSDAVGVRGWLVLALVSVWSVRLSAHITRRNWGQPEDHRYETIRRNNEPGFRWKSLYIVFGLQGVLAWLISAPLLGALAGDAPLGWLDAAGVALWLLGMVFEVVGDRQLARFKAEPDNRGRVLDHGLWRYTRHPNYFGEFCIWWGYYLLAVGAGAPWSVFAPVLMSVLLLRVSGVALLERDIAERRPGYRDYVRTTNAFFPGRPRGARA